MVTLSADKLPPHYAFPDLKWTMIPVEDFTGPTIAEIKKFLKIVDDARRNGEVRPYDYENEFVLCWIPKHRANSVGSVKTCSHLNLLS